MLDSTVEALSREFRDAPAGPFSYRDRIRIQDAWRVSESVKAIATAPSVLHLLRGLYGREPIPFQTLNFAIGTCDAPHSDAVHFNSIPPGFMCGVWVALEDIEIDSGPLYYYPGSHKLAEVSMKQLGAGPYRDDYPIYSAHVRELIEREGLEARNALLRKGQALLWAANLLHGGSERRDESRSRRSQVTHYFFEGCRYYTPMLSDRWITYWRDPVSIR